MKKHISFYILIFGVFVLSFNVNAQVGIGTTSPNTSSILDLTSTSKGILIPRMTSAQKSAVSSPGTGLLIYQTDGASGFWYYSGSQWLPFLDSQDGWTTTGNSGTTAGTNFIGTTDGVDFVTKTNNTEKMRMTSGGNLGIGTSSPTNILSFSGQAARTIWMERNTTAATAGNSMTLQSGGAYSGGSNLAGGDINVSSGTSTGTGTSNIYFKTSTAGASGTADNAPSTKMTILGSGYMGIGTTTPTNILSLSGQAARTIWMERNTTAATAGNALTIQAGGSYSGGTNLAGGDVNVLSGTSTGTGTSNIYFKTSTAGASGTSDNAPSTKMSVLGSGNIGIGTTSPSQLLEVSGGSILTNRAYASSTISVAASTSAFTTGASASSQIRITDNNSGSANGNLTYGATAIEGQVLWITNADAQSVNFTSTSPTTTILSGKTVGFVYVNSAWKPVNSDYISNPNDWAILGNSGTSASTNFIGTTDAVDFVARTNNTEKVRITSGGNVGIGATSPGQKLETMNGNVLINNNNNTAGELRFAEPSTSGSNYTAFKAQAQSANVTYTLPNAQGDFNSVLTNDGSGNLTWGNGGCQFEIKATDQSVTSSTTLVDDNAFTFTVSANHTYEITATIKASCSSSGSFKFQFTAPSGSTEFITVFANRSSLDDITFMTSATTAYNVSATNGMSSSTDMFSINGTLTTTASGTFKLQWAQNASNGTASTLYAGSFMKVTLAQ